MKVLFVGFGNVGRKLAEILVERSTYAGLAGLQVSVVGITTGSKGARANPVALDLVSALAELRAQGRFSPRHPDSVPLSSLDAIRDLDYDVMIEMSPLDVEHRGEPARSHVRAALERGRHVVSANKGPVAWGYRALRELARARGCHFLHEATVMDGVPVFNLARHCLKGAVVGRVEGILNSTTNHVLGAIERGGSLEEAVAEAQRAGVAEADPRLDLEGWDAAVKLAALANVLMDAELVPEAVERDDLAAIPVHRILDAVAAGRRVKMICEAFRDGSRVIGRVKAREVPRDNPFALVEGTSSILRITTDLMGTIAITEESPDLSATAYGIVADLLELQSR